MNEITPIELVAAIVLGFGVGLLVWRLISGRWIPDGSFSASQLPSGVDWKKVDELLDHGGGDALYQHKDQIYRK